MSGVGSIGIVPIGHIAYWRTINWKNRLEVSLRVFLFACVEISVTSDSPSPFASLRDFFLHPVYHHLSSISLSRENAVITSDYTHSPLVSYPPRLRESYSPSIIIPAFIPASCLTSVQQRHGPPGQPLISPIVEAPGKPQYVHASAAWPGHVPLPPRNKTCHSNPH